VRDTLPNTGRRPVIVGVGNAARGDDAAGLLVARRLGGIELEGDASALLELFDGVLDAIVIDTMRSGSPPGTTHRFDASEAPLPASVRSSSSTHAIGIAEAIELARTLGRLPARVVVYGIEGARFEAGAVMSDSVVAAIDEVVAALSAVRRHSRPRS
jgi:hydrogenase maturation protease